MTAHEPETMRCTSCGADFVPSCPHCQINTLRREDEGRRRVARDRDREALGLAPLARARTMSRWALRAARYWLSWALRFSSERDAGELTAALDHVDAAGRELGGL